MSASALRVIACAGALATGLLFGGAPVGIALADTGDGSGDGGVETTTTPDDVETPPEVTAEGGGSSDGAPDDTNRPTSTIGNGRNDVVDPNEPISDADEQPGSRVSSPPARKYKSSIVIPVFRIPTAKEFAAPGLTPPSMYFSTAEVPIPSLEDVFRAWSQPEPEPEPAPGPAFRTRQDAPVIDSTPVGGEVEQIAGTGDGPPVFEAPLVVAPPMPIPVAARLAPLGRSAGAGPSTTAGVQPAVAGVKAPLIRGTLPPSAVQVPKSFTPMSGQATRVGYPRYLRTPTVGELTAVALPGLGGLMFLTFSGGVIGYRQANSVRFIRTSAASRFLP